MKKILNNIGKLTICMVIAIISMYTNISVVNAAPETIEIGRAESIPGYVAGTYFTTKTLASGGYVYCLNMYKATPSNITARLVGERDAGFAYLMENGYPRKSLTGNNSYDYYITQTAVWWYLDETTGSSNLGNTFKTNGSDPYGLRPYIVALKNGAIAARNSGYGKVSLSLSTSNKTLSISTDKKYYVSESITPTTQNVTDNYSVFISSAPTGTFTATTSGVKETSFKPNESFKVYVPVSSVKSTSASIKLKATANGIINKAYEYQPTNQSMQNIVPEVLYPESTTTTASIDLNISTTKVTIIKTDEATNKALAGAKLVLKDSDGKVITSWTSTVNGHIIYNLPNGTYTVEETSAPKGYKKNKEPVSFTVTDSTKEQEIKIANKAKTTVVNIVKVDAETNEPITGAVLVVKDSTGKEVARFTSTTEAYVLTDLEDGTYTVEELEAPNGYNKSDEIITFTIDDDNATHQITFKNYKEVIVPNTSTSSLIITTIGIIIIGLGIGYIRRNVKKKA